MNCSNHVPSLYHEFYTESIGDVIAQWCGFASDSEFVEADNWHDGHTNKVWSDYHAKLALLNKAIADDAIYCPCKGTTEENYHKEKYHEASSIDYEEFSRLKQHKISRSHLMPWAERFLGTRLELSFFCSSNEGGNTASSTANERDKTTELQKVAEIKSELEKVTSELTTTKPQLVKATAALEEANTQLQQVTEKVKQEKENLDKVTKQIQECSGRRLKTDLRLFYVLKSLLLKTNHYSSQTDIYTAIDLSSLPYNKEGFSKETFDDRCAKANQLASEEGFQCDAE
ncbi:MAG: hypothetical protein GY821_02110 [Gammaproteobacteria bacterium]|nr:hypothetical protein [Gammaproteobacteria bacterium]